MILWIIFILYASFFSWLALKSFLIFLGWIIFVAVVVWSCQSNTEYMINKRGSWCCCFCVCVFKQKKKLRMNTKAEQSPKHNLKQVKISFISFERSWLIHDQVPKITQLKKYYCACVCLCIAALNFFSFLIPTWNVFGDQHTVHWSIELVDLMRQCAHFRLCDCKKKKS